MAKICSECGKQLSFRDSFVFEGNPVCKDCLRKLRLEHGQKLRQAGVSNAYRETYQFKTLLGYGKFISGLGWFIVFLGIIAIIAGIASRQTTGFAAAIGGVITALMGISFIVSGQVVSCFVSIEKNTRETYEILKARS